ncbi:hypothetical protein [Ferrovibrio sp.]|uniref:hypothetical protein n=1 Tax=Ferrovibrio sp. TaxID=1917215 RepID=UPI00311E7328
MLAVLLAGCMQTGSPGEARFDAALSRDDADWDAAMARSEATLTAEAGSGVARRNGQLELMLADGRVIDVAEDRACATRPPRDIWHDCLRKYAIWRFPQQGFWLLAVRLYAGEAYALVDMRTGAETRLIGPPHFSPDGRHLVAVNAAPKGGDTVSGVEVWSLAGPVPELVFFRPAHLEQEFRFADWAGGTVARLTVQGRQRAPQEAVLYFANRRWQLSQPR